VLVVIPGLEDYDVIAVNQVHEACSSSIRRDQQPCRHVSTARLADPRQRIAKYRFKQAIDPLARGPVRRLPVEVVLPAVWREDETH